MCCFSREDSQNQFDLIKANNIEKKMLQKRKRGLVIAASVTIIVLLLFNIVLNTVKNYKMTQEEKTFNKPFKAKNPKIVKDTSSTSTTTPLQSHQPNISNTEPKRTKSSREKRPRPQRIKRKIALAAEANVKLRPGQNFPRKPSKRRPSSRNDCFKGVCL